MNIQEAKDNVRNYANLPYGWDSYTAPTPSRASIDAALEFLDKLGATGGILYWIGPTSDGSIILECINNGVLEEWDFYNDGDSEMMLLSGKTEDKK